MDIPDGEVYTAPVKNSVNGVLSFNVPTPYLGFTFEQDTERINHILDTDEGARYIGEFSLGFNPYIKEPMKDILFDEKIDGSFHFTPGTWFAFSGQSAAAKSK